MVIAKEVSNINTDVLIIGGGSAACRAAIEAFSFFSNSSAFARSALAFSSSPNFS